jgi:hypothetical protein
MNRLIGRRGGSSYFMLSELTEMTSNMIVDVGFDVFDGF